MNMNNDDNKTALADSNVLSSSYHLVGAVKGAGSQDRQITLDTAKTRLVQEEQELKMQKSKEKKIPIHLGS